VSRALFTTGRSAVGIPIHRDGLPALAGRQAPWGALFSARAGSQGGNGGPHHPRPSDPRSAGLQPGTSMIPPPLPFTIAVDAKCRPEGRRYAPNLRSS
jgi:hypothetical protein